MGLNRSVGGDAEVCVQIPNIKIKPMSVDITPNNNSLVLR